MATTKYTAPGMSTDDGAAAASLLQDRLSELTDLQLTLKHVHWNVIGPNFIAVHRMLDRQFKGVRKIVDQTAERIATLGGSPIGTLAGVARDRASAGEYPLGREDTMAHLAALNHVYDSVISNHRQVMQKLEDIDLVTQNMLMEQLEIMEQFQWFVRAHLEDPSGALSSSKSGHRESSKK